MQRIGSCLLIVALLVVSVSTVLAKPITKMVVFGDSLSDNGNLYEYMKHQLPLSPPYFNGRFSNGYVWAELLAQKVFSADWSAHFLDYAFGGAGVLGPHGDFEDSTLFALNCEIDSYLLAHQEQASADSLFVVWIGANNYLTMPDDIEQAVNDVGWGIRTSLQRLVDHGAQHILVINLPDLGQTPLAREFDTQTELHDYSASHNSLLEKNMTELTIQNPTVQWLFFDINALFQQALKNPQQFGLINVTDSCSASMPDMKRLSSHGVLDMVAHMKPEMRQSTACNGYFFFDLVHPTAFIHQIVSDKVYDLLEKEGVVFSDPQSYT